MRTQTHHITASFGSPLIGRSYEADTSNGYRFSFNGKEKTDEIYGDGNGVDFGARILDTRLGRFLSIDPLFAKYPFVSPFVFTLNAPVFMIDREGNDNVVYLVVLPSAYTGPGKITTADVNKIIETTNASYRKLGLKTEVKLVADPNFNSNYTDPNDRISVIGDVKEVKAYIKPKLANNVSGNANNPDAFYDKELDKWQGGGTEGGVPEISQNVKNYNYTGENGGKFIAINGSALKTFGDLAKGSIAEAGAFLTMHGMGHTVGINHNESNMEIMDDGGIVLGRINGGSWLTDKGWDDFSYNNPVYKKLTDFMDNKASSTGPQNEAYVQKIKEKMGNNDPKDNYKKNKTDCEERCSD